MAITCTVPYRGATITGATFRVRSAYWKQISETEEAPAAHILVYEVEITMPDGSILAVPEWQNCKAEAGTGTPLAQAEAAMLARLEAAGGTNIEEV